MTGTLRKAGEARPQARWTLADRRPSLRAVENHEEPVSDPGFVHLHVHSSYSLLEGALTIAQARGARQGRPPAGARADRHRQHVRRAGILREARGQRHPADRRLRARGRFRRPGSAASSAAMRSSMPRVVLLAAREEGYRNLMRLTSRAFLDTPSGRAAARQARRRSASCSGRADRAHRRPGRSARSRDRGGPDASLRRRAARSSPRSSATGSMSNCSGTDCRRRSRSRPALLDLAYAQRPAARRDQRAVLRAARGLRGARRADLHRRRARSSPRPSGAS